MKVVFEQFLPLSWAEESGGGGSSCDSIPCHPRLAALELVMALCRAGRGIASQLVSLVTVHHWIEGLSSKDKNGWSNVSLISHR